VSTSVCSPSGFRRKASAPASRARPPAAKMLKTEVGVPPYVTFGELRNGAAGLSGYLGTGYNPFVIEGNGGGGGGSNQTGANGGGPNGGSGGPPDGNGSPGGFGGGGAGRGAAARRDRRL